MRVINGVTEFTGIEYVELALAGAYGLDGKEWITRLLWVEENRADLHLFVDTAKDKFQYMKALAALEDVCAHKPTGYCVGMDAILYLFSEVGAQFLF